MLLTLPENERPKESVPDQLTTTVPLRRSGVEPGVVRTQELYEPLPLAGMTMVLLSYSLPPTVQTLPPVSINRLPTDVIVADVPLVSSNVTVKFHWQPVVFQVVQGIGLTIVPVTFAGPLGVRVIVAVGRGVKVSVGVRVGVTVRVAVWVTVGEAVGVSVIVGVLVEVGVRVGPKTAGAWQPRLKV